MAAKAASTLARRTTEPRSAPRIDWLRLESQLCFALYSSSLAMTKLYKPLLEPLGLTYPQYLALLVLWEQDGIAVGSLGERLFLDSGTLTPLLKRLEAAGLVRRERSVDDERRVLVHLTDEGRALRARARGIPRDLAGATGCTADEVAGLTGHLQRLRARLHAAPASVSTAPIPASHTPAKDSR
jgi:MarR family transcriptional regulator, organic hydroperoxide resistance regulator